MKTKIMLIVAGLVAAMAAVMVAEGQGAGGEGGAQETEVTKNPAVLVSPSFKAGEASVYGVRLGDSVDKIPSEAGVTAMGVPERAQDTVYAGRSVRYYANDKKIYCIAVIGDLAKQLPTYDAARLQMALGKADESIELLAGEDTRLSFFARHVRYTVHAHRVLSLVTEVDLYAP